MSRVAELLEKFEDLFQPASEEEFKKRIEGIDDEVELRAIAVERLEEVPSNDVISTLFTKYGSNDLYSIMYDDIVDRIDNMVDSDKIKSFIMDVIRLSKEIQ